MIEFKRIYIDTSPYIYYLEKNPQYSDQVKNFFMESYNTGKEFVTSTITVEEYAIVPYREKNKKLLDDFDRNDKGRSRRFCLACCRSCLLYAERRVHWVLLTNSRDA